MATVEQASKIAANVLSNTQVSLLLYLETRAVDYGGIVDTAKMNAEDMAQAKEWAAIGFIGFGRICTKDQKPSGRREFHAPTHWVCFNDGSWGVIQQLRRERAERSWAKRNWRTTDEKREPTEPTP